MKLLLLSIALLVILADGTSAVRQRLRMHSPQWKGEPLPPDEWFTQRLDHFDPTNEATWKQRFFTNATYFAVKRNAPVFLMIGGEGEASPVWMVKGAWMDYAAEYGALAFQLEHRFYGKSHPTPDMSVENLKFLNSEQALADLAYFIEAMSEKYKLTSDNKWVVFGGSYPGSLAAWVRLKYPHLVHAAISSSGPLLAKSDFKEYFEVVRDSLNSYGSDCGEVVREATQNIQQLMSTPNGPESIADKFKLCNPINVNNSKDLTTLYESFTNLFADVVQYNKDNRFTPSPTSNITIDDLCIKMTDPSIGDPIDRMASINEMLLERMNQACLDFSYINSINPMKEISWNSSASEGGRQWTYQTCTEFGFYQTSPTKDALFSDTIPVNYFVRQCADIFGEAYSAQLLDKAIWRTNNNYGDLNIKTTRTVYIHGSIDPWHALGITESPNNHTPTIYITGTAHCANMYPPSPNDPPQLRSARRQISRLIGKWLFEN